MKIVLNKALEILGAALLVGTVAVVLWQVSSRTVPGDPNMTTEELVRFSLVRFAVLSSAYVMGQEAHLAVTVLSEKLTSKKSKILEVVVQSLFLVFAAVIMMYGRWSAVILIMGRISSSLSIPMGYVYLSVPISGVFVTIYSLINLIDTSNSRPVVQEKI